jgi:hypothetical protein
VVVAGRGRCTARSRDYQTATPKTGWEPKVQRSEACFEVQVCALRLRVQDLRFRVQGFEVGVWDSGYRIWVLEFGVWDSGFRA